MMNDFIVQFEEQFEEQVEKIYVLLELDQNRQHIFLKNFYQWAQSHSVTQRTTLWNCLFLAENGIPMPWESNYKEEYCKYIAGLSENSIDISLAKPTPN